VKIRQINVVGEAVTFIFDGVEDQTFRVEDFVAGDASHDLLQLIEELIKGMNLLDPKPVFFI
jgi:hypothetical protein